MNLKFQMSDKQRAINNAKSDGLARVVISNSFAADPADEEKRSAHCRAYTMLPAQQEPQRAPLDGTEH